MKYVFLGFMVCYAIFFGLALFNNMANQKKLVEVKKQSLVMEKNNLSDSSNKKVTKETAPKILKNNISIDGHVDWQNIRGQKLTLGLTVKNNAGLDINDFRIVFENNDFLIVTQINASKPKAQFNKNTNAFAFGKLPAGSSQTYYFEANPNKIGTFSSQIRFQNGEQNINDTDGNAIKDSLKITTNAN